MDTRLGIKQVRLAPDYKLTQFAIPGDLKGRIQAEALRLKVSQSEIIRRACEVYLGLPLSVRGNGNE
jgi:hypothetical protein